MTAKETMKLALHALESADWYIDQLEMLVYSVDDDGTHENRAKVQVAITAIKEALAQPEQEPVAWPMEEQPDGTVIPVDPSEMSGDLVLRLLATPPAATQSEQEPVVCKRCIELESLCDATYVAQGADAYVKEWSQSAVGLGLAKAPQSVAELKATMDDFMSNDLGTSEQTAEVVKFILAPPLGAPSLVFYKVLAKTAISTLTSEQRKILGLKPVSKAWRIICAALLNLLSFSLGKQSPSQEAAMQRIERRT